jgi:hypothetical protein
MISQKSTTYWGEGRSEVSFVIGRHWCMSSYISTTSEKKEEDKKVFSIKKIKSRQIPHFQLRFSYTILVLSNPVFFLYNNNNYNNYIVSNKSDKIKF